MKSAPMLPYLHEALKHARNRRTLDAVADKVLAHKPKPKSKPARKRARRAKKIAQAADV
jgi:hypothetical protein